MFCGSCNGPKETQGPGYMVRKENQEVKYYSDYNSINQGVLNSPNTTMVKVNRSSLDTQISQLKKGKVFTDPDFAPNEHALGQFDSINIDKWKRVSFIAGTGKLFGKQIAPKQATSSTFEKEKSFQAAVACLAQHPQRIKSIFSDTQHSNNGVYTMLLRQKGDVQEIVVDDHIPVDNSLQPIFSKPVDDATWMMILEKGRAKLYGNYQKMMKDSGNVNKCLQQLTFAPTESIKTETANKDDLWEKILLSAKNQQPIVAETSNNPAIQWYSISLTPQHYYTVLDAAVLLHKLGSTFKILKLRNAFRNEEYAGEGSRTDTLFWDQVEGNQQKSRILSSVGSKEGIIYILYSDYIKFFECTHINQVQNSSKYLNQELFFGSGQNKHGLLYQFQVEKEGNYVLSVDQNDMVSAKTEDPRDGWSRTTILIAKDFSSKAMQDYEYVDGVLKYNEQIPSISSYLQPGRYLTYIKLDPTLRAKSFPSKANLVAYSSSPITLKKVEKKNNGEVIKSIFLNHGRKNKRQLYNNDLMWSSWKLVPRGGYAYLAFGNENKSQFKFVIKVDKEVLFRQNFVIKQPRFEEVIKTIEVFPGQEEILLLRICNSEIKEVSFPPPIELQILPIL